MYIEKEKRASTGIDQLDKTPAHVIAMYLLSEEVCIGLREARASNVHVMSPGQTATRSLTGKAVVRGPINSMVVFGKKDIINSPRTYDFRWSRSQGGGT